MAAKRLLLRWRVNASAGRQTGAHRRPSGFFDGKQSLRMSTNGVGAGEGSHLFGAGIELPLIVLSDRSV